MQALKAHLPEHVYLTVQEIVAYVQERFGVAYTVSGMTDLLHRFKFVYKKPKMVPGKPATGCDEEPHRSRKVLGERR